MSRLWRRKPRSGGVVDRTFPASAGFPSTGSARSSCRPAPAPAASPLLTAGRATVWPYFTMPFVEGESLRVRLRAAANSPSQKACASSARSPPHWPTRTKGSYTATLPDNVLHGRRGHGYRFWCRQGAGASTDVGSGTMTSLGTRSARLMAPERGRFAETARADICAWGIMAYELPGRPLFPGRSPRRFWRRR
jgi:hypothetical protein